MHAQSVCTNGHPALDHVRVVLVAGLFRAADSVHWHHGRIAPAGDQQAHPRRLLVNPAPTRRHPDKRRSRLTRIVRPLRDTEPAPCVFTAATNEWMDNRPLESWRLHCSRSARSSIQVAEEDAVQPCSIAVAWWDAPHAHTSVANLQFRRPVALSPTVRHSPPSLSGQWHRAAHGRCYSGVRRTVKAEDDKVVQVSHDPRLEQGAAVARLLARTELGPAAKRRQRRTDSAAQNEPSDPKGPKRPGHAYRAVPAKRIRTGGRGTCVPSASQRRRCSKDVLS